MENENKEIETQEIEENEIVEEINENPEAVDQNEIEEVKESEKKEEEPYTGKEVTTSIRYDYRTMKYFNMYNAAIRRKLPIWYIVMGVLSAIFAIYTIVDGVITSINDPESSIGTSTFIITAIFVFFTIYLFMQAFRFEGFVDKTITNHFLSHKVAEQHIRIREDKITLIPVNKPDESFSYDWVQITSIEEINEFFFLYIGKSPLIIDKDPSKMINGTYEEMLEIINEKIAVKPYKKYTKQVVKKPITFVHQEDIENINNAVETENIEENNEEQND